MDTLQTLYAKDSGLLAFYEKQLLKPGWAGELTTEEAQYIADSVSKDRALRATWRKALRISGYTGQRRKKPSAYVISMWNDFLNEAGYCEIA